MTRFIKVMPLLALFLGLTVFLGNAAVKKHSILTSSEWRFTGSDPTEPGDYTPTEPDTQLDCVEGDESVCVVIAPADGEMPDLGEVDNLLKALKEGLGHPNIIRGPYDPN